MLPKTFYNQTITSYSFQVRGDLPSHMGDFYRDADMSRSAFETARAAQILPQDRPKPARGQSDNGWRTSGFHLPDPHPSFAAPNRKWREDGWFQKLRVKDDGTALTKEEFFKMRQEQPKSRRKGKERYD